MPTPDSSDRPPQADFATEALPHLDQLAGFACWIAESEADADDLVQETDLKAFRNWGQYQAGTDCRAWLFTICRNTYFTARAGSKGRDGGRSGTRGAGRGCDACLRGHRGT
ncbi:MAG: sigma factor [Gemmatimonadota bacterium]|nr:sigma factor [Gemmatimonadota bacterium]